MQFTTLTARAVPLVVDHIDTDQIIPARFLKVTDKAGLDQFLFADWRKDPDFVLNQPESQGAQVLLAGANFGCGSSREHAPWALAAWGFRAVVAPSFADIFSNNALKNALLPIALAPDEHAWLVAQRAADPALALHVDLAAQTISAGDRTFGFDVDPFARRCLLEGIDQLGYLQSFDAAIAAHEAAQP